MATPPTFVSFGNTVLNTTTEPKTVSVTVQTGDLLIVASIMESATSAGPVNTAPTGGSLTYSQLATLGTTNSHARAIAWSAPATGNATFSVSAVMPSVSTGWWGLAVWVWRSHNGTGTIGAPTVNSTSNLVTMTTAAANSALCVVSADWNAVDGTTRTRRTVNGSTGTERGYFRDSVHWGAYQQDYADTGAAGSISAGYSGPAGQATATIGIEVKAAVGGAATSSAPVHSAYRLLPILVR
jgi:hypothetical protein